jgi:transposase
MELHTLGIDLGKTVFHAVSLNKHGEVVLRKKFSRGQLLRFTVNLKVALIGMESCGGAHFLGRALRDQGHEVRLIPAQYVKPFVKTNKNDYIDAEAIAEAVGRPTMRFVPIKSDDQLDLQSLHRVRERWVMRRTAAVNQIRSLLLERGVTLRKGRKYVDQQLPGILEDADMRLTGALRTLLAQLKIELDQLAERIAEMDRVIQQTASEHEGCKRMQEIPGIGPVTATAIVAAIGTGQAWQSLFAKALRTRRACGASKAPQPACRPERLARTADDSQAWQRSCRCASEQVGPHGVGGAGERPTVSASSDDDCSGCMTTAIAEPPAMPHRSFNMRDQRL